MANTLDNLPLPAQAGTRHSLEDGTTLVSADDGAGNFVWNLEVAGGSVSGIDLDDGSDTWTIQADGTNRHLTISLNGTAAFRLTRQSDGTVDLAVTGTLANQTIT